MCVCVHVPVSLTVLLPSKNCYSSAQSGHCSSYTDQEECYDECDHQSCHAAQLQVGRRTVGPGNTSKLFIISCHMPVETVSSIYFLTVVHCIK